MTATRPSIAMPPRLLALACGVLMALALPAAAHAASTRLVRYAGWQARVPVSWPVYRLGRSSHTCVRFNRHAVYLGVPGASERCPAHAAGRTEAILVTPRAAAGADALTPATAARGVPTTGAVAVRNRRAAGVSVTATWGRDPAAVRSALGVGSVARVRAAARAYARRVSAGLRARLRTGTRTAGSPDASTPTAAPVTLSPATPGEVYTGLGFDACSAPSQSTLAAWGSSPFRALGVYIGGAEMACAQTNLTAAWVSAEAAAGWHLIPIYVGLQAPGNGCGCAAISATQAAAQGAAAAQAAVAQAQALGLGAGNPVYYDMENYPRTATTSDTVLTFLGAWTSTLHAAGYSSGVYSSELSGIADLVAEQGTGYGEPDDIWIANWNGAQSTADAAVPSTDWADHERLHQFRGGHTDDYGGASISIDSDYLDAATAAPGDTTVSTTVATAPTVSVRPQPNGTVLVTPSWTGQTAVSRWAISAGATPTTLQAIGSVPASRATLSADTGAAYFQVQALNAAGQALGTSGAVAAPSHVAMFGHSAFVASHGPGGLPVECFAISGCRVSTQVFLGHRRLTHTGFQSVPAGGGIVLFSLTAAEHALVTRAGNAGVPVTVSIRSSTGSRATRVMRLERFTTSGPGPLRVKGSSPQLKILGVTDFVSHGWTGGILVACRQSTPCTATPTLRIGSRVLTTARAQTIGAQEVGYLVFHMTAAGHVRLMHTPGNQLGVSVSVVGAAAGLTTAISAHARIAIDAF